MAKCGCKWFARSTVFGMFFAGTSFYLAMHGMLTPIYVSAMTAVHAFIIGRAVMDDYHERNSGAPQDKADG